MKKNILFLLILSSFGLMAQSILRNSVTTNSEIPMVAFIDSRVVSPTNGITAGAATNIAAYQAQIATNGLVSGVILKSSGSGTNTTLNNVNIIGGTVHPSSGLTLPTLMITDSGLQRLLTRSGTNLLIGPIWDGTSLSLSNVLITSYEIQDGSISNADIANVTIASNKLAFAMLGLADLQSSTNGLLRNRWTTNTDGVSINGSGLTNLHGTNIQALTISNGVIANATISTNKMDATAYAAFMNGGSGSASNAVARISTNGVAVLDGVTNLNIITGSGMVISTTNGNQTVGVTFESTGGAQTPWVTDIQAAENTLFDVAAIMMRDTGGSGSIQSSDGSSFLQIGDGALGIIYEVSDGDHEFHGPVTITNLTGTTQPLGNSSTAVATTAFVQAAKTNNVIVNVKDFGAVADTTTDNTAAFQAAINAVAATGGDVFVPRVDVNKYYRILGPVLVRPGTSLIGEGQGAGSITNFGAAIYHPSANTNPCIMLAGTQTRLENLYLYSDGTNSVGIAAHTNQSVPTYKAIIRNVNTYGFSYGFHFNYAWTISLENCAAYAAAIGLYATNANALRITGGEYSANDTGILISGYNGGTGGYGNTVQSLFQNNRYAGCIFDGGLLSPVLINSSFEANKKYNLIVQGSGSYPVLDAKIMNNQFSALAADGAKTNIYITSARIPTISGNQCTDSTTNRFLVCDSSVLNPIIKGNYHPQMGAPVVNSPGWIEIQTNIVAGGTASFYGLLGSGNVTNAAGSRVAYLSDTSAGAQTNVTDTASYASQVNSNLTVKGSLTVYGASAFQDLTATNFVIATNWDASLATNLNASELRSGTVAAARLPSTVTTNNGTLTSTTLLVGDGARGVATTTTGTGVLTALGIATNTAGGLVTQNGPLGTPSSGSGANLTALSAANITAGGTLTALNAGSLTNLNYDSATNTWTIDTAFPLGQTNQAVSIGTATGGITGIANGPSSGNRWGELIVFATGTVTFTNPAAIHFSDGLTSRTITNGTSAVISVKVWSGFKTNAAIVHFP